MSTPRSEREERLRAAHLAFYDGIQELRPLLTEISDLRISWWRQDLLTQPSQGEARQRDVQRRMELAAAELLDALRSLSDATQDWVRESREAVEAHFAATAAPSPEPGEER